jgi:hypothetical protein
MLLLRREIFSGKNNNGTNFGSSKRLPMKSGEKNRDEIRYGQF